MANGERPGFSVRWGNRALYAFLALVGVAIACSLVVFPLIGLVTGDLYLLGRSSHPRWIEGSWARILSALLLLIAGWLIYRGWKTMRKKRLADTLPVWQRNEGRD